MCKKIELIIIILFSSLLSCKKESSSLDGVEVSSIEVLEGIPSASGSEDVNEKHYIIGDDSPWLFEVDDMNKIINKIPLLDSTFLEYQKIPKKIKPDFESIVLIEKDLFVFGSGSKKKRTVLKLIDIESEKVKSYSLKDFYDTIMSLEDIKRKQFNIEGVAVTSSQLFLVNRENNALYEYSLEDFKKFILENTIPIPIVRHYKLPSINSIESTFSGLDYDQEKNRLVFTSSVEDKTDPINDGAILGSFIGEINLDKLNDHYLKAFALKKDGEILPVKAESVSIMKQEKYKIVTDSDGNGSKVLSVRMK
ncbi:hypothetical protein UJ101_00368 [Flavobacteriaceae bacterium UJ101]|nr:hypothetical protein UJ101_00368 [Flavobacteriaceae bacterium UJ101]